jgi:hypothetical protein
MASCARSTGPVALAETHNIPPSTASSAATTLELLEPEEKKRTQRHKGTKARQEGKDEG